MSGYVRCHWCGEKQAAAGVYACCVWLLAQGHRDVGWHKQDGLLRSCQPAGWEGVTAAGMSLNGTERRVPPRQFNWSACIACGGCCNCLYTDAGQQTLACMYLPAHCAAPAVLTARKAWLTTWRSTSGVSAITSHASSCARHCRLPHVPHDMSPQKGCASRPWEPR